MTDLGERQSWLLLLVDLAQFVDGDTRLQKYMLITSKDVVGGGSYDDWRPYHYGAYSDKLAADTTSLAESGLVSVHKIRDNNVYTLSERGKKSLARFMEQCLDRFPDKVEKIRELLAHYQGRRLQVLLADTYRRFPEYSEKSRIKDDIDDHVMASMTGGHSEEKVPGASGAKLPRFPYGDEEFRTELAKSIGLDEPPDTGTEAYDDFAKLFSKWRYDKSMLDEIEQ